MKNRKRNRIAALLGISLAISSICGCGGFSGGSRGEEAGGYAAGEEMQTGEENAGGAGGQSGKGTAAGEKRTQAGALPAEKEPVPDISEIGLLDKKLLYSSDDETSVVTMYLTVRRGNASEGTDHSWEEINTYSAYYYDELGIDRYQVEGLLQMGDENGPAAGELGYTDNVPNATVQIRGQTSSRAPQKNYKIRLKDGKGLWRQQQTINLNKHQSDGLRFRNKLGFDLLKGIPQTMSLRTQFVHLYVKDETDGKEGKFEDYGLYTQVEQLNKKGMRAHGLDPNGHLYKINRCEFYRYEDTIKPADDPSFDQAAFDNLLECKANNDHTKLIRLLDDVNDYSIPPSELLEKHFDVENLTYWMAFHILVGNVDTQNRNFYLYSPQNSEKWYILSWDNDAIFKAVENELLEYIEEGSWESGISNYWGNVLFQRCLKSDEFRNRLDGAITDLKGYLSQARLESMVKQYREAVEPYVYRMPDRQYASLTPEGYDQVAETLYEQVEKNYQGYLDSLKKPLPFFMGTPAVNGGKWELKWDTAYDFQKEDITYEVTISDRLDMQNVLVSYRGAWPVLEMDPLPEGQYFIRAKAVDASGNEQDPFDYYVTENGKVFGTKCFYVLPDGTIEEDIYEE